MQIGYDAKRAFLNNTGLGNYSRWLIKTMAQHYPENTYVLYTPEIKPNSRLGFLNPFKNIHTVTPQGKLIKSWWRSNSIVDDLVRDHIEIYHGLSHELPLGIRQSGVKSVVTVHDLIFMRMPEQFGRINRAIYGLKVKKACSVADKVIAISQKTKDDVVELLNIDPKKIEVLYQGCDPSFNAQIDDRQKQVICTKYGIPSKFILNVGTIEERKNLLLLIKALPFIEAIPLVVVGKPTQYLDTIKQYIADNNLTDRIIFIHNAEFADLPAIYQSAPVFVYPSRYEGFGIPVLEAISSGTPVIAATGTCLEEAGGPGSLYTDPDNEADLAEKINSILNNPGLAQNMREQGLAYATKFDEYELAAQLMQLYQSIQHA
ncbi:MAG TPA: glycosyltransferase family 1 protein [Mucilaginibacter sp.]|jgi:glycosyltransferase involved in cell wall biosynthesis|nr:glycosyltransferase family 1 protein [Mucilaginibacter sp.]